MSFNQEEFIKQLSSATVVELARVVDGDDVLVVDAPEELRLLDEPGPDLGIGRPLLVANVHRRRVVRLHLEHRRGVDLCLVYELAADPDAPDRGGGHADSVPGWRVVQTCLHPFSQPRR